MFNMDVRAAIREAGLRSYQLAQALGISEWTFSRKLNRSELSEDEKKRIFSEIDRLYEDRDTCRRQ